MCSVDARSLEVRLTDSALASDLFPDAYHARVDDERPLPVRWMALELLETVSDRRTIVSETSADVVSAKPNAEYCMSMSSGDCAALRPSQCVLCY